MEHRDAERIAVTNLDSRVNIHTAADQLARGLAQLLPHGATEDVPGARPAEAPTKVRNLTQLHTSADDRKEERVTEDADQMMVHQVLEAGGSSRVRARHPVLQAQTRSVWEDHPLPRDQNAFLPVDHLV